jgi:hypothetical protein
MTLVQPLLDGLTPPAEASLGLAGVAAAESDGDLGLERAALISGESPGPGTDQGVKEFDGVSVVPKMIRRSASKASPNPLCKRRGVVGP